MTISTGVTTDQLRSEFLKYFKNHQHAVVSSASLVPQNDPTLLFTNAGMVPFKNVFTGQETRPYTRATTAQKVVRAGGKHNDLDNVGYTARHLTFFEMLGNFSFGDYFKAEAIEFAWNLLTRGYGLPKEKLLATVYAEDEEAAGLWRKIAGLPEEKIIRIPTADNFWRMGDTGPCGPCSEIFFDHGPDVWGGIPGSENENGDRFIEIWNIVFMQYLEQENGHRDTLNMPCVDTGMGLERFAAVMQNKSSVYDTDILKSLVDFSSEMSNSYTGGEYKSSHRVIADHIRSSAFLIADGVMPSNTGRGYVLRRILRRAIRHLYKVGNREPSLYNMVEYLVSLMSTSYPELNQTKLLISETIKAEEEKFGVLLEKGMQVIEQELEKLKSNIMPGETAFKLYDTFGFPLDLTQDFLKEKQISVDVCGFEKEMLKQKQRSKK